jgi:hypothetical protein
VTNKISESIHDAECITKEEGKDMKQNSHSKDSSRNAHSFPLIDSHYHVATMPNFHGGCARRELLSFRNISGEYFRNEARGEFQQELIAFTAMVLTAAVPILSNLHALADFLRSIGSL